MARYAVGFFVVGLLLLLLLGVLVHLHACMHMRAVVFSPPLLFLLFGLKLTLGVCARVKS